MTSTSVRLQMFEHSAAFYRGLEELLDVTVPFLREGVAGDEVVVVAEPPVQLAAMRDALGPDAAAVRFVDVTDLGHNPARLIPAWIQVLAENEGRRVRAVGEPAWFGRRRAELDECTLHEALLHIAFADLDLACLCAYDTDRLPPDVVESARRTHGVEHGAVDLFAEPLPPAPVGAVPFGFDMTHLPELRAHVGAVAAAAGLAERAVDDLVLAVHELGCNSVEHGGSRGELRAWTDGSALVLEVRDRGTIHDPLVGRSVAPDLAEGGRGIWMANQLCDLVQVRSSTAGTTVRLHTWL